VSTATATTEESESRTSCDQLFTDFSKDPSGSFFLYLNKNVEN
jgi:hypothetical protein